MKQILFTAFFCLAMFSERVHAQDSLYTMKGQGLSVVVEEVNANDLHYKLSTGKAEFGPIHSIAKSETRYVKYSNGVIEKFAGAPDPAPSATTSPTAAIPPAIAAPPKTTSLNISTSMNSAEENGVPVAQPQPAPDTSATLTLTDSKQKLGLTYTQTLASDSLRMSWIENGGKLEGTYYGASYTYMSMSTGGTDIAMNGVGITMGTNVLSLDPPNRSKGKTSWGAPLIGSGVDLQIVDGGATGSSLGLSMFQFTIAGKFSLGYTFGFGNFSDDGIWSGTALSLMWQPALQLNTSITSMDMSSLGEGTTTTTTTSVYLNLAGFGASLDFGSFEKMVGNTAKAAHFSIYGFVIPETSKTPFMMSIGIAYLGYSPVKK